MIKNLITRALSGLVFVAVMVFCIYMSDFFYGAFFLILTIVGLNEFYTLTDHLEGSNVHKPLAIGGGILLYIVTFMVYFMGFDYGFLSIIFLYFSLIMIVELFRNQQKPILNIALSHLGILYVALPFALMTYVESIPEYGWRMMLCFFIIIWCSDTGAYLVGVCCGKHKMFERISPKKTWEGFAGGCLFAILAGVIFYHTNFVPYTLLTWCSISVFFFLLGVVGDLVESMIKRNLEVKDSGRFLPGHGGLLDRFDSALIAAPGLCLVALLLLNC